LLGFPGIGFVTLNYWQVGWLEHSAAGNVESWLSSPSHTPRTLTCSPSEAERELSIALQAIPMTPWQADQTRKRNQAGQFYRAEGARGVIHEKSLKHSAGWGKPEDAVEARRA
jgi:hypothetical protein